MIGWVAKRGVGTNEINEVSEFGVVGGSMSRNKGQRGEREAAKLLMGWAAEVVETMRQYGYEVPDVELVRNLNQARVGSSGSYDLVGLDWLALEVKRHETLNVSAWWRQTLSQVGVSDRGEPQVPLLMYRQNNQRWKFMTKVKVVVVGGNQVEVTVTMDEEQTRVWLSTLLWFEVLR